MERLKAEIERLRNARPDDAEKRRADKLEAEVVRLRDLLEMEKRKWESERRTITEKVRAEVDGGCTRSRRPRGGISDLNEEIKRLQRELERLLEDVNRFSRTSTRRQADSVGGRGMDISDLFPMGLAGVQLGPLSRPEWRQLFQQLVAELVCRKRTRSCWHRGRHDGLQARRCQVAWMQGRRGRATLRRRCRHGVMRTTSFAGVVAVAGRRETRTTSSRGAVAAVAEAGALRTTSSTTTAAAGAITAAARSLSIRAISEVLHPTSSRFRSGEERRRRWF